MTESLSAAEAKARFAEAVRRAERGETIIVTRHGRAVAKLAPIRAPGASDAPIAEVRESSGNYRPVAERARSNAAPVRTEARRLALERLLTESIWPRIPKEQLGERISKPERERILGYGEDGL